MDTDTISIVAALIRDDAGRVLLVRKRGTAVIVGIAPIMVMWFGFDWQSKAAVAISGWTARIW